MRADRPSRRRLDADRPGLLDDQHGLLGRDEPADRGSCCGIGNLSYIGTAGSTSPHPCSDAILSQLRELYPAWYKALTVGLAGVQPVIYLLVIILLALPTSREFFHRWR